MKESQVRTRMVAVAVLLTGLWAVNGGRLGAAPDLTGRWDFSIVVLSDTLYRQVDLKVDGERLSGTVGADVLEGNVNGTTVEFHFAYPDGFTFPRFTGTLTGDELSGTGLWDEGVPMRWLARRSVQRPGIPKAHDFSPTTFHRVFSDAIPPALRISPKDTVRTWTVDANGVDRAGVSRSLGGNPETGPFFVEGAFPGDTLVVTLNRVRLNRPSASSGSRIVGPALTPADVERTKYQDNFDSEWVLDFAKGTARLARPSEGLKDFTVKLQPMIGCLAVAPASHQAFQVGWPGAFGGNMDYNQLREGATVYLPVFVPGALLFIGDGHAAQGDGELTGNALETSMDVEFTIDLIKGYSTGAPRSENDEFLMSSGIANSLPDALQRATSQLAAWLGHDYKLNPNEVAIVLGTSMRYDIAEIVDPLVHVVAKISKDVLKPIKK